MRQQLEVQTEQLDTLISQNKTQRLNAVSASNVQKQDLKNWRVRGAEENWTFFENTVANMKNQLQQFSLATESIEDAINSFQKESTPLPAQVGQVITNQYDRYLSLAGRVAELHEQASRFLKRRKQN